MFGFIHECGEKCAAQLSVCHGLGMLLLPRLLLHNIMFTFHVQHHIHLLY